MPVVLSFLLNLILALSLSHSHFEFSPSFFLPSLPVLCPQPLRPPFTVTNPSPTLFLSSPPPPPSPHFSLLLPPPHLLRSNLSPPQFFRNRLYQYHLLYLSSTFVGTNRLTTEQQTNHLQFYQIIFRQGVFFFCPSSNRNRPSTETEDGHWACMHAYL